MVVSQSKYSWRTGFILHIITGIIATFGHYGAMWLLLEMGLTSLYASSGGFVIGAITRFLLSYFHVFSPTSAIPKAMGRFVFALSAQMACNALLLAQFIKLIPLWEAQVTTTIALTVFNYIAYRVWVFR